MKLEDMQEILAKMTPRPWRWNGEQMLGPERLEQNSMGEQVDMAVAIIETDSNVHPPREHDAAGILAMVNNADDLMTLLFAVRKVMWVSCWSLRVREKNSTTNCVCEDQDHKHACPVTGAREALYWAYRKLDAGFHP